MTTTAHRGRLNALDQRIGNGSQGDTEGVGAALGPLDDLVLEMFDRLVRIRNGENFEERQKLIRDAEFARGQAVHRMRIFETELHSPDRPRWEDWEGGIAGRREMAEATTKAHERKAEEKAAEAAALDDSVSIDDAVVVVVEEFWEDGRLSRMAELAGIDLGGAEMPDDLNVETVGRLLSMFDKGIERLGDAGALG